MTLYLDTETTGLTTCDRLIEIGVVNDFGQVVFESLINPGIPIPAEATAIHGITDEMVLNAPTFLDLAAQLTDILHGDGTIVIFNADFDTRFFPDGFWNGLRVHCALERYALATGRRRKLERAAKAAGHGSKTAGHRAVADAHACRAVWQWLDREGLASPDRFANVNAEELAKQAWDAQLRAKEATAEFNQIKSALIASAKGEKRVFTLPGIFRITVSAQVDTTDRATYQVDREALGALDPSLRQMLFDVGVTKISDKIRAKYSAIRFTNLREGGDANFGDG
jgi:DNA polymerase III epsilon subunit-like protein